MSTGAIIAIVAGAVILLIVFAALVPRMRSRRRHRQLETRRGELASQHRDVAAEQQARARAAQSEAKRAEAEAELHEARAELHEQGLADEEIRDDGGNGRTDDAGARGEGAARRA